MSKSIGTCYNVLFSFFSCSTKTIIIILVILLAYIPLTDFTTYRSKLAVISNEEELETKYPNPRNLQKSTSELENLSIAEAESSTTSLPDLEKVTEPVIATETQTPIPQIDPPAEKIEFICPTFDQLNFPPADCNFREKKYPKVYKHDFFTIHAPYSPGPSEQTNGLKHVFMATAYLNKGLMVSNFTVHKTDRVSKIRNIPFGLRVDMDQMCNFIHLTSAKEKLQHYLELDEKIDRRYLPVSEDNSTFYLNDILIVKGGNKGKDPYHNATTKNRVCDEVPDLIVFYANFI